MSVILNSSIKTEKDHSSINTFIIISLCALTLSVFSLLILIIYINYQNNRIVDIRDISKQYHESIHSIIKEMNLLNEFNGYKEIIENKKWVTDGEYNIYISSVDVYDKTVKALKKKIYEAGIGIKNQDCGETGEIPSFFLEVNGVKIAKINIGVKKEQNDNESEILRKNKEFYSVIRNFLLKKYVSSTEIMESLPEPISDGSDMWFHKKFSLFISDNVNDNTFLADLKNHISENFNSWDIKTNKDERKNTIEYSIYIDNKKIITINIQKFLENFTNETTSTIKTSLVTQFPVNKYIEEYIGPIIYFNESKSIQKEKKAIELTKEKERDKFNDSGKKKPKVSIILDDGGFRNPDEDPALELTNKINISILPDTRYTKELSKKALEKGFEVMLHMPMQTKQGAKKGSFPCEVLINMSEKEIQQKTKDALEQISGVKGVNNHTGGVFTLTEEPLKSFMKVLKEKDLFFVDSVVIGGSKAYQVASDVGVSSLQRDIFLDHEYTKEKIKENLEKLKKIAVKKGKAVGIGHFRDLTIKVLQEELPKLEEQGFELVHISELFE